MNINSMDDEQLASEIIELARQDLKDSATSKEAQYEALGIIADFVKPKLAKFIRQCVKDSTPEGLTVEQIQDIVRPIFDEFRDIPYKESRFSLMITTRHCDVLTKDISLAIYAAQKGKGKDSYEG